jgi:hypothetical protein
MQRLCLSVALLLPAFALEAEPCIAMKSVARQYVVRAGATRRGRPRKFSRPARAVTLTLPEDTIATLRGIDRDLGRAIVRVVQPHTPEPPRRPAELVRYGNRAVILVTPTRALKERTGAELVPLADGRALLSFDNETSVSQFELRLLDALADPALPEEDREIFVAVAEILRNSRRSGRGEVRQRNIIVFHGLDDEGVGHSERGPRAASGEPA